MSDDELTSFPRVVDALRAPAQGAELAGEDAALAMFRRHHRPARRGRTLRRIGIGGAGVVLGLGLTGGVAAAYTTGLPDPVQDAVHSAISPLGLPAPPTAHARRMRQQIRRELRRAGIPATAIPRLLPVPAPLAGSPRRAAAPQPALPSVAQGRSASPTPASTPAAPPPALSATVSRSVVPVHSGVVLSGRLTRSGTGLADRQVYAAEQLAGTATWRRVASGRTTSDGRVSLTVPPLTSDVRLRLVTGAGVASRSIPVAVVPKLSVSLARSQGRRVATISADGGRPGDALVLLRRDGDTWTRVASTALDGTAEGQFTVPGPATTRVRYRVRLPATGRHAASFVEFVVPAR